MANCIVLSKPLKHFGHLEEIAWSFTRLNYVTWFVYIVFFSLKFTKKNLLQGQCGMFCMRNEANKFGNLVELFSKLKVQVSQKLNKGGFP